MTRPRVAALAVPAIAAGAIAAVVLTLGRGGQEPRCPRLLVPAYVGPAALEEIAAAPEPPRIVVVNPANGPGAAPDPAYRRAIARLRERGSEVLGYVATTHGARPLDAAAADARRWAAWHGVDGIFLDEVASDAARLPYYRALVDRVRASGAGTVALNPGVVPARGYFDLADVVVTFEGPYAHYGAALARMPGWVRALPPDRVAHLAYGATPQEAQRAAARPPADGYAYVTTGVQPNPWQTIPPAVLTGRDGEARCG